MGSVRAAQQCQRRRDKRAIAGMQLAVEGEAGDVDPPGGQQRRSGEEKAETCQPDDEPESDHTGSRWGGATACAETVRGGEHGVRCLWTDWGMVPAIIPRGVQMPVHTPRHGIWGYPGPFRPDNYAAVVTERGISLSGWDSSAGIYGLAAVY
jgi:hypothetical protein